MTIWTNFLGFEIERSRTATQFIGSANGYLIFQIICWHHLLILIKSDHNNKLKLADRDKVEPLWTKYSKEGYLNNTVLTYSLISQLSALSVETVRRHVAKLINNNWVKYSIKTGVIYQPNEENNKYLAEVFNVKENQLLIDFLLILERLKK